jgi:hypothetical protein
MPETMGLSLEDIQKSFAMPGTVARRGRFVSLLRRWVGVGGAGAGAGASDGGSSSSQASGSEVELRDVGDLLNQSAADEGVGVASIEIGSVRAVSA